MPIKKSAKKGGFQLTPILLSQPVRDTDGFSNLVDTAAPEQEVPITAPESPTPTSGPGSSTETMPSSGTATDLERPAADDPNKPPAAAAAAAVRPSNPPKKADGPQSDDRSRHSAAAATPATKAAPKRQPSAAQAKAAGSRENAEYRLTVPELLRILEADSLEDVYELSDVLRASSLKLYATLVKAADERGRARIKNFDLMDRAGIRGIATLYKQERWLSSLRLVEKKAKPGPHDGSSYVVFGLDTLPLPDDILRKFAEFMASHE